jgi:hypothetical protein
LYVRIATILVADSAFLKASTAATAYGILSRFEERGDCVEYWRWRSQAKCSKSCNDNGDGLHDEGRG